MSAVNRIAAFLPPEPSPRDLVYQLLAVDPESGRPVPIGETTDPATALRLLDVGERCGRPERLLLRIVREGDERLDRPAPGADA